MVNDRKRSDDLAHVVKRARQEAQKVSFRLLVTSLIPLSQAHITLKARHAALVRIADEAQAEIERLHA